MKEEGQDVVKFRCSSGFILLGSMRLMCQLKNVCLPSRSLPVDTFVAGPD